MSKLECLSSQMPRFQCLASGKRNAPNVLRTPNRMKDEGCRSNGENDG